MAILHIWRDILGTLAADAKGHGFGFFTPPVRTCAYMHVHRPACVHVGCGCVCAGARASVCMCMCACACACACARTCVRACVCVHVRVRLCHACYSCRVCHTTCRACCASACLLSIGNTNGTLEIAQLLLELRDRRCDCIFDYLMIEASPSDIDRCHRCRACVCAGR